MFLYEFSLSIAISGILGAYLLLYPHARVLVLVPYGLIGTFNVSAAMVLVLCFLMQVLSGGMSLGNQGGGVAFFGTWVDFLLA